MIDPDFGALIAAGASLLLLAASWPKWRSHAEFLEVLRNYRVFPEFALPLMGRLIPALEAAIGIALWIPNTRSIAALCGAALILAYAGGIAANLARGRLSLDCGCAAPGERRPIAGWMVARNILLGGILACAALPWSRPLGVVDVLTVVGGLLVLMFLYLTVDRLVGQVMPRAAALRRPT
jgi:hypothetical protein